MYLCRLHLSSSRDCRQHIKGENDVLRDEGEAYAHKLLQAGVPVTAVRYHGTIQDFVMLNAFTDDPAPRGAIEQASHILKKVLST
jgi:acetyl esterase